MIDLTSQNGRTRRRESSSNNVMDKQQSFKKRRVVVVTFCIAVLAGLLYQELVTVNLVDDVVIPVSSSVQVPLQEDDGAVGMEKDEPSSLQEEDGPVTGGDNESPLSSQHQLSKEATNMVSTEEGRATRMEQVPSTNKVNQSKMLSSATASSGDDYLQQEEEEETRADDKSRPLSLPADDATDSASHDNSHDNNKELFPITGDPPRIYDLSVNRTFLPVPENRSDRFPSVQERVKLYMGDWYLPPCRYEDRIPYYYTHNDSWPAVHLLLPLSKNAENHTAVVVVDSVVHSDRVVLLERRVLEDCARLFRSYQRDGPLPSDDRVRTRHYMHWYCADVLDFFELNVAAGNVSSSSNITGTEEEAIPALVYFGDSQARQPFPLVSKYRGRFERRSSSSLDGRRMEIHDASDEEGTTTTCVSTAGSRTPSRSDNSNGGMSPILWQVNKKRHYYPINKLKTWERSTSRIRQHWNDKHDKAIWLGAFTGPPYNSSQKNDPTELCRRNLRCNFVLQHVNSTLVEAKFTDFLGRFGNEEEGRRLPPGLPLEVEELPVDELLHYKILISLEGNDVASGLKWQLYSECLVMMPPPTRTTWAMEELLEPWVHYVPIFPNGSNTEDMVRWVLDHPSEAQRIVQWSQAFLHDLVEDMESDMAVRKEIVQRYRQHWRAFE